MQRIRLGDRSGQAMILFALLFVFLAGMLGIALDGTRLYYEKRRAQAAADSGAVAGVQEMRRGRRDYSTQVRPAVVNDTGLHGYSEREATITVNQPPLSGPRAGDENSLEVIVAKQVPTTLMGIVGPEASTVRARAVGGLRPSGNPCIIVLDPDDRRSFKHNGTPTLQTDCDIVVNSRHPEALAELGSGCIDAPWIGVTGGYSGDCINPTPKTSQPPVVDPLLNLDPPGYAGMADGYTTSSGGTTTYWPGYYDKQIKITNGVVQFMPGTYVLEKGMKVTGGQVTGAEVFFYNINASGKEHIDFSSNERVQLSAPTSGPYKGMLFFNNRDSPDRSPGHKLGRGTLDSYFAGALYFPSQHLDWAGNPESYVFWTMVIANTLDISGTSDIQVLNHPTPEQAPPAFAAIFWE